MAIMCPSKPHECPPESLEGIMFDCLEQLPDQYYVFHSFKIVNIVDNEIHESETDFVIFHPEKGLLCLEAKAGHVTFDGAQWRYGSGDEMKYGGPYRQANRNMWKLKDYIELCGLKYLLARCKLMFGVWFPSVDEHELEQKVLVSEADRRITLTKNSRDRIEEELEALFSVQRPNACQETRMTGEDVHKLLYRVLAPSFDLMPVANLRVENQRYVFKRMLREQVALLNYLEEQETAVINGLAGTGKTMMALEKAKRHADQEERVLFLCYNVFLKEYLQTEYAHPNISYYTIDGLACKLCDTATPQYDRFKDMLETMYIENSFPYKHVIIDEGQDFGKERMNDIELIELLKGIVSDGERGGTFYVFYDRNQMVQAEALPSYIAEADCKLTLYRNCRNTENIATTSLRLLGSDKRPKLFEGAVVGDSPEMFFAGSAEKAVFIINSIIDSAWEIGYEHIQILTCKTERKSIIADECSTGWYLYKSKKIPFTTCRKYKGLEADVIIMVDMDEEVFTENAEQIMYVGSSRARYKLFLVAQMDDGVCARLLEERDIKRTKKPGKAFAALYNSKYRELQE